MRAGLLPRRVGLGCKPEGGGVMRARLIGFTCPEDNLSKAVESVGPHTRIADLAEYGQALLKVCGGLLVTAEFQVNLAEPGQNLGFAACATDFPKQGQGLLEVSCRVLVAAPPQVNNAEPG
jgi:hypothetical protein